MKLKSVTLVSSVFFNGSSQGQVFAKNGDTLEINSEGFVVATPNPTKKKDTVHIPMSNVRCYVLYDEKAEALALEAKNAEAARAAAPPEHPALKGVVKLKKNEDTGEIEEELT